jgi:branched-chain amino acid transport system substrate-binding protein
MKIGMIEDMSSVYADLAGVGAVTAARMAVEDFGGKVLGKPIEVVAADHQNKPDIASATAPEWFAILHVNAIIDVAASATALAEIEVAKTNNKIIIVNGPGATRFTNEACTPVSIHYTCYDSWFFITVGYVFGHDLE